MVEKKCVLVINDEITMIEQIGRWLNSYGYKYDSTISGEKGLKLIKKNIYDIILLDYHLNKTGIESEQISGYRQEEFTHLAVAAAVASGRAECGLGIAAAAEALELEREIEPIDPREIGTPGSKYDFAGPRRHKPDYIRPEGFIDQSINAIIGTYYQTLGMSQSLAGMVGRLPGNLYLKDLQRRDPELYQKLIENPEHLDAYYKNINDYNCFQISKKDGITCR